MENSSERFDRIEQRLDGLDKKVDELDKKVDGLDKKVDGLEQRFEAFRGETGRNFADLFAFLNEKFAEMQRHIDVTNESHRSDISAVNDKINGQADRLDGHDRDITVLQGSHQDLHGRVAKLERK